MVGKFLLGMVSGGLVVTGGLVVGSLLYPTRPANDNAPVPAAEAPIAAPEATAPEAGAKADPVVAEAVTPVEPEAEATADPAPAVAAPQPEEPATPAPVEGEATAAAEPAAPAAGDVAKPATEVVPSKPAETTADPAAATPEPAAPVEAAEPPETVVADAGPAALDPEPAAEPAAAEEGADMAMPETAAETAVAEPALDAAPVEPAPVEPATTADAQPAEAAPVEPAPAGPAPTELAQLEDAPATLPAPEPEPAPAVEAAPVVTEPATEAPAEGTPMTEAGTESVAEAPAVGASAETEALEAPVAEASTTEAPAVEAPSAEAATTEIPAAEQPATEQPATEQPATDQPATELTEPEPLPETAPLPETGTAPGAAVAEMPGTRPAALPGTTGDSSETAVAEENGSTFKPAPGLVRAGEGVIIGRGTEAAVDPAADEGSAPVDQRPIAQYATSFENPDAKPGFAIVLVDDGSADLDRIGLAALPFPVSFALDPLDPATPERAAIYRAAGKEVVMLVTGIAQGAQASDVEVAFQSMEQGLPEAVAVMDLADPVFQNNRGLASAVVPILKAQGRGLLTWDEGLNAADQVARREDLEAAVVFRNLDQGRGDKVAVRRLLDRAVFKADQDGRVSVVGTADPATVAALLEWTVEGKAATVALAPLTAVLRVD